MTGNAPRNGKPKRIPAGAQITPTEYLVAMYVRLGFTNGGIGDALHLSEDTIKTHVRRIASKLRAPDRAAVVDRLWALKAFPPRVDGSLPGVVSRGDPGAMAVYNKRLAEVPVVEYGP